MKPSYLTDELDRANETIPVLRSQLSAVATFFRGLKVWMSFKRYGANQSASG